MKGKKLQERRRGGEEGSTAALALKRGGGVGGRGGEGVVGGANERVQDPARGEGRGCSGVGGEGREEGPWALGVLSACNLQIG